MDRIVVISNPTASQFTGGSHRSVMAALSDVARVEAEWPGSASETTDIAREAAESGAAVVAAMGGDGMVHHVAQGLVGTESALGIIPVGTTNVVARILHIPRKPTRAARVLTSGYVPRRIGVASMTLARGTTQTRHYSVFACGFGLDAAVVVRADRDPYKKYRFGSIHYLNSALGVALTEFPGTEPSLEITHDEEEGITSAALVQFRSVYTFFGKIPVRLTGAPPDPMTLLTIDRLPRHRIPQVAAVALSGRELGQIADFEVREGISRIELTADPPIAVQADGEALGQVDGGVVEWLPDSLLVIAPQEPA